MDVSKLTALPLAGNPERVAVVVIHGFGRAEPGWINDDMVDKVGSSGHGLSFNAFSEVYRLPETISSDLDAAKLAAPETNQIAIRRGHYFLSVVRSANLPDNSKVSLAEMHWADLSKASANSIVRFLVLLRLLFEAPNILAASLLKESRGPLHGTVRRVVLLAIWLLRWPIAGLHVAIFGSAFGYAGLSKLSAVLHGPKLAEPQLLPFVVLGLLAIIAIAGIFLSKLRAVQETGLTSLFEASAVCSLLLAVFVAFLTYVVPVEVLRDIAFSILQMIQTTGRISDVNIADVAFSTDDAARVSTYLATGGWIIIAVWAFWSLLMFLAYAAIGLIGLWRFVRPPSKSVMPLGRLASATGLAVIQSIAWKLIICPASLLLIVWLVPDAGKHGESAPNLWSVDRHFGVNEIAVRMVIIAVLNMLASLILAAVVIWLSRKRARIYQERREALLNGTEALPRLIVSPALLIFLFAINVATTTFYYVWCKSDGTFFTYVAGLLFQSEAFDFARNVLATGAVSSLPALLGLIFASFKKETYDVVQFTRGVVDNFYTPRTPWHWLQPWRQRIGPATFPRRMRLQERLETLMKDVVVPGKFDRLIFLTHSQGTVIMFDYLRSMRSDHVLNALTRIDVVTLACPLSHIYEHYFDDHCAIKPSAFDLSPKLASWTNMWRADDPIGQRVDAVAHGFVQNRPLPAGGHSDYFKEDVVCSILIDLIKSENRAPRNFVI